MSKGFQLSPRKILSEMMISKRGKLSKRGPRLLKRLTTMPPTKIAMGTRVTMKT